MRVRAALAAVLAVWAGSAGAQAVNDYPTNARADYVFVCMATNGQTRDMLEKCSCAIDQIAAVLSYDDYVKAATVMAMLQVGGERTASFRSSGATDMVANFHRAEAEAEIFCF